MTRTTKSERKYGKKPTEPQNKPREKRSKPQKKELELYKVLIEGCAFSKPMSFEDCQKTMERYEQEADKMNQPRPSLMLVKV